MRGLYFECLFEAPGVVDMDLEGANRGCETSFEREAFRVTAFSFESEALAAARYVDICDLCGGMREDSALIEQVVYLSRSSVFVIWNYRRGTFAAVRECLESAFHVLREAQPIGGVVLAIGAEVDEFERLIESYQQAKCCTSARIPLGGNRIFSFDEMCESLLMGDHLVDVAVEQKLINALTNRDFREIQERTSALLDGVIRRAKLYPLEVAGALNHILGVFSRNADSPRESESAALTRYYCERRRALETANSFNEVYDVFRSIIYNLSVTPQESQRLKKTGLVVRTIQRYIEDNCRKDISISELAAMTGMNENYLCTIFKRMMGVSIHQYLIEQRMNRAKLLLRRDDFTISEIAEQVGYADNKYFSTQFKRRFGMTPGQYRNLPSAHELDP